MYSWRTPAMLGVAIFLFFIMVPEAHAFSGSGAGTSGDPYQITTCSELQEMSSALSSYYALQNDIDCSATTGWNSGSGFAPIGTSGSAFTGDLDGNGYAITDLFISRSGTSYVGLIGRGAGANIHNVTLTNGNVSGYQYVGMLGGKFDTSSTIEHINYTGTTTAADAYVGGLIGMISGATVQYATSTNIVTISTKGSCCSYAAGIVGHVNSATISDVYASSTVTSTNSGRSAGLFGETNSFGGSGVTIRRVYGLVAVTSPATGGFISFAYGSSGAPLVIENSGVRGIAGGSGGTGGFAYTTYSYVTFTNTYAAVQITSGSKGGYQSGVTNTPTITSSYWNSEIAGTANATASGSLAGQDLTATTTAAMKTQSTYTNWDFDTVWGLDAGINGGYPYLRMLPPDTVAPTVSLTSPTSGEATTTTMTLIASASDDRSLAGVSFYVDGTKQGSEDTSSPFSITYDTTATSTGAHTAFAVARDASNNYATSTSISFTTANTPTPSSVSASAATTSPTRASATLTWTTPTNGSSRVFFGLTSALASSTSESNTSTRVTSHSLSLANLVPCTSYQYVTVSQTAGGDVATSTATTFTTPGCTGSASVSSHNEGDITTAGGGSLTHGNLALTVPTSFTATSSTASFQASSLDKTNFFTAASTPSSLSHVGDDVFRLTAFTDATTTLSTFDQPITVTLTYSASDATSYDPSTYTVYRYDGTDWSALSSCTVDTDARTVSCTTTSFSDFALFGTPAASSSSSSSSSSVAANGSVYKGNGTDLPGYAAPRAQIIYPDGTIVYLDEVALQDMPSTTVATPSPSEKPLSTQTPSPTTAFQFTRTLRAGSVGEDVRELQKFLNTHGFILAPRGVGSPDNETDYFGPMTYNALVLFQEAHRDAILTPLGLTNGTGIFGNSTRTFVSGL